MTWLEMATAANARWARLDVLTERLGLNTEQAQASEAIEYVRAGLRALDQLEQQAEVVASTTAGVRQ